MSLLHAVLTALIVLLLGAPLHAEKFSVEIVRGISLDDAGGELRRAVTAYEAAMSKSLPPDWTRVNLAPNSAVNFGEGNILVLQGVGNDGSLLYVDADGPHTGALRMGEIQRLGGLEVIVLTASRRAYGADLMVRDAAAPRTLLAEPPEGNPSPTRITGLEQPRRIEVDTPSPQVAAFAREFLKSYNRGLGAEESARRGREASPLGRVSAAAAPRRDYTDPTNIFDRPDHDRPTAALVTLHLVRGESASLRELESSLAYDSAGNRPENPRVQASSDERGGTVTVGDPGDRFTGRLRLLEASGKASIESETFLRVSLGSRARLSLYGPQGMMSAWIAARLQGTQAVMLSVDQREGDWSFLGGISSQVRVRDGQTITLARNSYQRTTEQRSNVPILGDLPYIGPVFGNERSTGQSYSYALYATVSIE